jgi:hypothetical protein
MMETILARRALASVMVLGLLASGLQTGGVMAAPGAPGGRGGASGAAPGGKQKGTQKRSSRRGERVDPVARIDRMVSQAKQRISDRKKQVLLRLARMETRGLERARALRERTRQGEASGRASSDRPGAPGGRAGASGAGPANRIAKRFDAMKTRMDERLAAVRKRIETRFARAKSRIEASDAPAERKAAALGRLESGRGEVTSALDEARREVLAKAEAIRDRLGALAGQGD